MWSREYYRLFFLISNPSPQRYALNLIAPAQLCAKRRKSLEDVVQPEDLQKAYNYFINDKRSVEFLREQGQLLIFNEGAITEQAKDWNSLQNIPNAEPMNIA